MPSLSRRQINSALAFTLLLPAIPRRAAAAESRIWGAVTYRERIALPENAALTVHLVELIEDKVAGKVVAEQRISPAGQVPIPFEITYDPDSGADSLRVGLKARIVADGAVLFENRTPLGVDLEASDNIEIVLEKAAADAAETPDISGIDWTVEKIAGLDSLAGAVPTLTISPDGRAGGHGGCNRFFATATIEADAIAFSEIGSTFMACETGIMEVEQAYFAALSYTVRYRIEGGRLSLLDQDGALTVGLTASV